MPKTGLASILEVSELDAVKRWAQKVPAGLVVEWGCYRGGTGLALAEMRPDLEVLGLDTFASFPHVCEYDTLAKGEGYFADLGKQHADELNAQSPDNYTAVAGDFLNTATGAIANRSISMSIIDCDVFVPALYAWAMTNARIVPGGVVCIHDYERFGSIDKVVNEVVLMDKTLTRVDNIECANASFPFYMKGQPSGD